jgi:hypothetical protein
MDNAFTGRAYPGYTTSELKAAIAAGRGTDKMIVEVARREAVAAGDVTQMTAAERLRASNGARIS